MLLLLLTLHHLPGMYDDLRSQGGATHSHPFPRPAPALAPKRRRLAGGHPLTRNVVSPSVPPSVPPSVSLRTSCTLTPSPPVLQSTLSPASSCIAGTQAPRPILDLHAIPSHGRRRPATFINPPQFVRQAILLRSNRRLLEPCQSMPQTPPPRLTTSTAQRRRLHTRF